jgi:hypothetical protein
MQNPSSFASFRLFGGLGLNPDAGLRQISHARADKRQRAEKKTNRFTTAITDSEDSTVKPFERCMQVRAQTFLEMFGKSNKMPRIGSARRTA